MKCCIYWFVVLTITLTITLTAGCGRACRFPIGGWFASQPVEYLYEPSPSVPVYIDSRFQFKQRHRVAFTASGIDPGSYQSNRKMCDAFVTQFRKSGIQEAISPLDCHLNLTGDEIERGQFSEREFVDVSRRYNLDTIALVRINQLDATAPMKLGVTVAFVDAAESVVFCSIDHQWDLSERETWQSFVKFTCLESQLSEHEKSMKLKSPTQLFRFAAKQVVDSLQHEGYSQSNVDFGSQELLTNSPSF